MNTVSKVCAEPVSWWERVLSWLDAWRGAPGGSQSDGAMAAEVMRIGL